MRERGCASHSSRPPGDYLEGPTQHCRLSEVLTAVLASVLNFDDGLWTSQLLGFSFDEIFEDCQLHPAGPRERVPDELSVISLCAVDSTG